jgi:hypothetical protein
VSFTSGTGTATIWGTPTKGGVFPIAVTAKNSAGTTTQTLTLTVNQVPTITSLATATAKQGTAFTFTVKTAGYLTPAVTQTGALPAGLTFHDNGNGTATISGKASTAGTFGITVMAKNNVGAATRGLIITVRS